MAAIFQTTFQSIFLNENILISITISLKFVAEGPNDNKRELVQVMTRRRQAIAWTNADLVLRRIYAALGGDELNATL